MSVYSNSQHPCATQQLAQLSTLHYVLMSSGANVGNKDLLQLLLLTVTLAVKQQGQGHLAKQTEILEAS